jgi:hypothetical protein
MLPVESFKLIAKDLFISKQRATHRQRLPVASFEDWIKQQCGQKNSLAPLGILGCGGNRETSF